MCHRVRASARRGFPVGNRARQRLQRKECANMPQSGPTQGVKDGIVGVIRGTGGIIDAVTDTVSGSIVNAVRGTTAVGTTLAVSATEITRGVIQGTSEVGGDLGKAAKGAMVGVLRGTRRCSIAERSPADAPGKSPAARRTRRWGPVTPWSAAIRLDVFSSPCTSAQSSCMNHRTSGRAAGAVRRARPASDRPSFRRQDIWCGHGTSRGRC